MVWTEKRCLWWVTGRGQKSEMGQRVGKKDPMGEKLVG